MEGQRQQAQDLGEDTASGAAGKCSVREGQAQTGSSRLAATCTRGRVQIGLERRMFPEMRRRWNRLGFVGV